MKHVLVNMMLIILISISTAGCTVVRVMQTRGGYAVEKTVKNTEERSTQLSRKDFRLGFDVTEIRLGIRLEYRPYYNVEKRELVTYKPKTGRTLEVLMGVASVGLLSWAVFDNFVETGKFKINDEGELYNVRELDWNRASALQKAIMIGVPLDTILWGYYATKYEATGHEPWKRISEITGEWQLLGGHPYRIELPSYNFGKDYLSDSGNERVQISDFLSRVENPRRFKDIDSVLLRASTKFDGKAYQKILRFTGQSQLQPFRDIVPQGPAVHALLILLGNDQKIRLDVEQSGSHMRNLLKEVSQDAHVYLTEMKSVNETKGEVTITKLFEGDSIGLKEETQGLITGEQVKDWLNNLSTSQHDTILIYYNGHGMMDRMMQGITDRHILIFNQQGEVLRDKVPRADLRAQLEQKPGRLRMLITDTCSNRAGTLDFRPQTPNHLAGVSKRQSTPYIKNLFLQHEGILDITAAQPGNYAWSDRYIGGYFTYGLVQQSITKESDTDGNGFLTWQEVFKTSEQKTDEIFRDAKAAGALSSPENLAKIRTSGQKTQKPFKHDLPKPAK